MFAKALPALALLAGCANVSTPAAVASTLVDRAPDPREWTAACSDMDDWDKPGPPFRIHGNTYYVGTCGITALLVTGPQGHVLIDSGTDKGAEIVLANIRALGLDPRHVKWLLMSHEHFDHVGGMARLQAATGATVLASPEAAMVLRSGVTAAADPQAGSRHPPFPPVTGPIKTLLGETDQTLAGTTFKPIMTPGHTLGATSWSWQSCAAGECRTIVYVDSLNPISDDFYRFSDHPGLVSTFRAGIAKVTAAPCDIVLAPHPTAAALRDRLLGTKPLVDPAGCRAYAATAKERLEKRLARESADGR